MMLLLCKTLLRGLFLLVQHIICFPTSLVWQLMFLPVKYFNSNLYWWLVETLVHFIVILICWYPWSAGYHVVEMGDDILRCTDDRTLALINHQSTGDIIMLFAAFNRWPSLMRKTMWIMNDIFKYTTFGLHCNIRQDHFILTGKEKRMLGIDKLRQHLKDTYIPRNKKLIVLFPEGGFLELRRPKSQIFAKKNDLPVLNHVTLPRLGAIQGILDVFKSSVDQSTPVNSASGTNTSSLGDKDQLKWILDVTIAYPDAEAHTMISILKAWRKPCKTILFYRLFPVNELPTEQEKITSWLYTIWEEKDKILSTFYSSGKIPVSEFCANPIPPRELVLSPIWTILLNLFFIMSAYFHYKLLSSLLDFIL